MKSNAYILLVHVQFWMLTVSFALVYGVVYSALSCATYSKWFVRKEGTPSDGFLADDVLHDASNFPMWKVLPYKIGIHAKTKANKIMINYCQRYQSEYSLLKLLSLIIPVSYPHRFTFFWFLWFHVAVLLDFIIFKHEKFCHQPLFKHEATGSNTNSINNNKQLSTIVKLHMYTHS